MKVEDTGIGVVFADEPVSDVELVDAKDSALDSIGLLGKVVSEANVVDFGTQRGASSNKDFVVVSKSAACVKEFSFSPAPVSNIGFGSALVSSGLDPPVVSTCEGFCE